MHINQKPHCSTSLRNEVTDLVTEALKQCNTPQIEHVKKSGKRTWRVGRVGREKCRADLCSCMAPPVQYDFLVGWKVY